MPRSPSDGEVTVAAFPFPPGPQRGRVSASGGARSCLRPPAPGAGLASPAPFSPRTAAPLRHSGTAGRAGGWSSCCPPPVKWSPRLDSSPRSLWVCTAARPEPPAFCGTPLSPVPSISLSRGLSAPAEESGGRLLLFQG